MIAGTTMGNSTIQIASRASMRGSERSPSAASVPITVASSALTAATSSEFRVDVRHGPAPRKVSYHCSEKPFGGKAM